MSYEQSTLEPTFIGRRQALCTFAGIAGAIAGFGLFGIGSAQAAESEAAIAGVETVTAERAEALAVSEREQAMLDSLVPRDLDVGAWSVEAVHPPRLGAVAVVMRTPQGDVFQVDVLQRDDATPGVAQTKNFSLFIANRGDGSSVTDEWQARGAKVLAHHIRRTELSGSPLPELLTLTQRDNRHPFGGFGVLG